MTKLPTGLFSFSQSDAASFTEERTGRGAEPDVAQAIPVLSDTAVNVSSVPQRSPLRYPGGKTWLVPEIRKFLAGLDFRPEVFVEPFAGGGIASLTAVMDNYVDRAVLCERDPDISNLWQCMLDDAEELGSARRRFRSNSREREHCVRGCWGVRCRRRLSDPVTE